MSKIKDALLQAEETEDFSDEQMEKWREETRKIDELAEQWDGVYQQIDVKQDTESDSPPF